MNGIFQLHEIILCDALNKTCLTTHVVYVILSGYCNESQLMAGITIPLEENISQFACQQYCSEYEFFASHVSIHFIAQK